MVNTSNNVYKKKLTINVNQLNNIGKNSSKNLYFLRYGTQTKNKQKFFTFCIGSITDTIKPRQDLNLIAVSFS